MSILESIETALKTREIINNIIRAEDVTEEDKRELIDGILFPEEDAKYD